MYSACIITVGNNCKAVQYLHHAQRLPTYFPRRDATEVLAYLGRLGTSSEKLTHLIFTQYFEINLLE